ncbi:cobyrinate a,c-diamide synthase [Larsenimonas rhizosphaerae]|uniref:cobyrinate a,c-diamide synthase n=1 Tax=Larsenimonas rhizosphaerae TaxID=2944682 RepID=UPI002033D064|nr:cobyrinate a,c-diamide synthase [Larsenimonas rhizosphaerae]MCM2130484.1 cobyrinate a,c-diamide synthase [Larsenimonas rhizosphaerae]
MSERHVDCPALFISSTASGQGKTTLTAALARLHRRQGRRVAVFKTGPDYLDPLILSHAAGGPVEPLDLWMAGPEFCRQQLFDAARHHDLILIEGAMGLFDGQPSSADLAATFNIPVVAVINARGMAQTVAAVAFGLKHLPRSADNRHHLAGIVTNGVGSLRHRELIEHSLPSDIALLGNLPREEALALPSRHLGLVPPDEQEALDARFDAAADHLADSPLSDLPAACRFTDQHIPAPPRLLAGTHIAVGRDAAFSFIYAANLRLLEAMGARLSYFSPLTEALPEADACWLPGGYPELHAHTLSSNTALHTSLADHHQAGRPILAECGGMLLLQQTLTDLDGHCYPMAGLLPGHGEMRTKRGCQGMQAAPLPEGEIRGHAHHHSRSHDTLAPIAHGRRAFHTAPGEAIYRQGRLTASYLHLFFASHPVATAQLFGATTSAPIAAMADA